MRHLNNYWAHLFGFGRVAIARVLKSRCFSRQVTRLSALSGMEMTV